MADKRYADADHTHDLQLGGDSQPGKARYVRSLLVLGAYPAWAHQAASFTECRYSARSERWSASKRSERTAARKVMTV